MKNKKEKNNKKGFFKFILPYLLTGAVCGFVGAILNFNEVLEKIKINGIDVFFIKSSPYILSVLGLIISVLLIIIVNTCKKESKNSKYDSLDKLESKLNHAMVLSNILLFSMLILFGISFYNFLNRDVNILLYIITLIFYFIYIAISSLSQSKIVEIIKTIDPLKKGNIYDKNFSLEWLNSCDELERKMIYQASFKTFSFMNTFLISLFVILIFAGMFFGIGLFPMVLTGIISFVQNMAYSYYAVKIENNIRTFD